MPAELRAAHVIKTAVVQQGYLTSDFPIVHGWDFDVGMGDIVDLQIDFAAKLDRTRRVYDLGSMRS